MTRRGSAHKGCGGRSAAHSTYRGRECGKLEESKKVSRVKFGLGWVQGRAATTGKIGTGEGLVGIVHPDVGVPILTKEWGRVRKVVLIHSETGTEQNGGGVGLFFKRVTWGKKTGGRKFAW